MMEVGHQSADSFLPPIRIEWKAGFEGSRIGLSDRVINLNTAKALGIAVPLALRGRADELIE